MFHRTSSRLTAILLTFLISFSAGAAVLEEIIVTAQKRDQSAQDIGIAITAFSGEQLADLGYLSANEVTAQIPGVTTIQPNGPSAYFISIRGVGQNDFTGDHQESPVAIYVDDAYISAASGAGFQLFDVERVEVLRGPQGTLFGRNATGGLAHYVTQKPTDQFDAYGNFTLGSYKQTRFHGAVGGPLGGDLAGRVAAQYNRHDPYVKNRSGDDLNNGNDWALRGHLLWTPGENLEWLFSARISKQDIDTGFFDHAAARTNADGLGEFSDGTDLQGDGGSGLTPYRDTDDDPWAGAYDVIGFNKLDIIGLTSNLTWDLGAVELAAITDYWTLEKNYLEDSDASPNEYFAFYLKSDLTQISQEIRLSGSTERIQWVVGAYYLNIEGDFENGAAAGNFFADSVNDASLKDSTIGLYNPFSTKTDSLALFAQGELSLGDSSKLILGLRWTREDKEMDYAHYIAAFESATSNEVEDEDAFAAGGPVFVYNPDQVSNAGAVAAGLITTPFTAAQAAAAADDASLSDDLITFKLEFNHRLDNDTLLYVSYNRGIKAGGYNSPFDAGLFYGGVRTLDEMKFDAEVLNAYEAGFKMEFGAEGGRYRLNGALYYYDYQDYQAFNLEGLTTFVFNTDAVVYGGELELQARPVARMDVVLGVGYLNNNVEDAYTTPEDPATSAVEARLLDRVAVLSPEWTLNALVRYEWPLLGGLLAAQADANYLSEHYFQIKNSPVTREDGYVIFNARLGWTSADERWSLALFGNNLGNKDARTMVFDLASPPSAGTGFGMAENYYRAPRWFGLSVGVQL